MADRQAAVKSVIAAMNSLSKIQQEQNKIKMQMFLHDKEQQDNFFNQMRLKKEMLPLELEAEKQKMQQKAQIEAQSPEGQLAAAQLEEYKKNPGNFTVKGGKITPKNIADPGELPTGVQIQARALARKIYGVRGAEQGLPSIYAELNSGKTIDQIEDDLRFSGQSKDFVGPVRSAAQSILMSTPEAVSQKSMDYIDDLVSSGDTEGVKNQLKRLAFKQAPTTEQSSIMGKERTVKLIGEIERDIEALKQRGVDTGILRGTAEQIANKIGKVSDPQVRQLATKVMLAVQNYRRSMSGVAFPEAETKEYREVFPGIGKDAGFNAANIGALKDVFGGDLDNFYSMSMGENNYKKLFKEKSGDTQNQKESWKDKTYKVGDIVKTPKGDVRVTGVNPNDPSDIDVEPISNSKPNGQSGLITAINRSTGKKLALKNNKWVAYA